MRRIGSEVSLMMADGKTLDENKTTSCRWGKNREFFVLSYHTQVRI